jgi:hypothetical protein
MPEFAESYFLLQQDKDHIRFTDTRGWYGVTDETTNNIERILSRQMTKRKKMENYEREVCCLFSATLAYVELALLTLFLPCRLQATRGGTKR